MLRIYETVGKIAVFLEAKTVQCRFWWDVLGKLEHVFGNISLDKYVYILVLYAVYELCLTLDGVRIFIWPCN